MIDPLTIFLYYKLEKTLEISSTWKAPVPVETDYVALAWEALEELKEVAGTVGEVITSSCIPSLSSAGAYKNNNACYNPFFLKVGEGLRKACMGKQSLVTLTTR